MRPAYAALAVLLVLSLLLPLTATAAPGRDQPTQPPSALRTTASPDYGVSLFLWKSPDLEAQLASAHAAGFTWQKSLIRWRDVEGTAKSQLDWSAADLLVRETDQAGLRLLVRVDFPPAWARADGANNGPPDSYQDYADFVGRLMTRYKKGGKRGRIAALEIWNEPNLSREWGGVPISRQSAADYVRLLCGAYQAAKHADPTVTVLSAGLSPTGTADGTAQPDDTYLQWLYDAGLRGCSDAVGAHAPGYKAPPEVSPDEAAANPQYGGQRAFTFRRVEDLRHVMEQNGDAARQVWITEFGWTSDNRNPDYAWHAVTEDQKAQYLVDAYRWARQHWSPWIGLMAAWTLADPTWTPANEEYWWSLTDPNGAPRPALTLFSQDRAAGVLP